MPYTLLLLSAILLAILSLILLVSNIQLKRKPKIADFQTDLEELFEQLETKEKIIGELCHLIERFYRNIRLTEYDPKMIDWALKKSAEHKKLELVDRVIAQAKKHGKLDELTKQVNAKIQSKK
ncbi:MAG: hypothetical protein AB8G95_20025 [Anaerolineae bacterium]